MKVCFYSALACLVSLPVNAGILQVDPAKLPNKTVHETAKLTPLALSPDQHPAVVLLDLEAGQVVPPHATKSGLRLITVLSGDLYWGDGNKIDPSKEQVFKPGSLLVLPAEEMHWLAARKNSLRLQLVVLDDEMMIPSIARELK